MNLTATGATASGYLTMYPDGPSRPIVSSLNYVVGGSVANMSIMPLGTDGAVRIFNGGSRPIDVVVDLVGSQYTYPPS